MPEVLRILVCPDCNRQKLGRGSNEERLEEIKYPKCPACKTEMKILSYDIDPDPDSKNSRIANEILK
jgi:hypothetical protein